MKRQLAVATCALLLAGAQQMQADPALDWNAIAFQTISAGGRPGPTPILDLAVVHTAVHDAVQAYDQNFEPYATEISGASGSPAAAVAKAARDVLVNRFPAQTAAVDAAYASYFAANGLSTTDAGVTVGARAASGVIALRANDGSFPAVSPVFVGANVPGAWRPTPSF